KKAKPQVQVSAAVWRKHRLYRAALKQDWLRWVQEGWLDFVVPMDYTADHQDFRDTVRAQVANTAGKMPIAAGIAAYMQKTPEGLLKQIDIARQEGTDGYVVFAYKTEGFDEMLDALGKGPQAQPAYPAYRGAHGSGDFVTPERRFGHLNAMLDPTTARRLPLPDPLFERKDDVPASVIGGKALVKLRIWPVPRAPLTGLNMNGFLEDLNGRVLQRLSGAVLPKSVVSGKSRQFWENHPETLSNWINVPLGRARVVTRGSMTYDDGRVEPFVVRGPIIEGLPPEKIAELRAQKVPPQPIGPGRRVAVYTGGQAQSGLLKMLQGAPGLNVYPLYRLRPEHWKMAQVLILPHLNDVAEVTPAVMQQLRAWVQGGGVLILTHDAVGYRWHPRLFPEIGRGMGALRQQQITIVPNEWGLAPATLSHAFPTHVKLQPAPGATVLARDAEEAGEANGDAVLIAGRVGRGVVIMYGSLLGYMPNGVISEDERRLLLQLVQMK
ncbi:MAG TPA: hypothetical protein VNA16_10720, partial [Abditibacteriaceae bacterium]|nr:hypothetical protein [Abditibacteriaceae bacterium]